MKLKTFLKKTIILLGVASCITIPSLTIASCSKQESDSSKPDNEQRYEITINGVNDNYELNQENSIKLSISPSLDNVYYDVKCTDTNLILRQEDSTIFFKATNPGEYVVNISAYDNANKNKLLSSKSITLNIKNIHGISVDGLDKITNKFSTDESISFDKAIRMARSSIEENNNIVEYLKEWSKYYVNVFTNSRNNCCIGEVTKFNVTCDKNNINGNIKIEFTWTKDMEAMIVPANRNIGDKEIHNFVFNNNKLEPYINTAINNFLSFKIKPFQFQKKLITSNIENNYYLGFNDETIYLDNVNELTINLNNSIFNININNFLNSSYTYVNGNNDEKKFIEFILNQLLNKKANLLIAGDSPITNNYITSPLLRIKLDNSYNVSERFLRNLVYDLYSVFYFISPSNSISIKNGYVYIKTINALIFNVKENELTDLTTNTPYNKKHLDFQNISNWYSQSIQLKNTVITNNESKINNSNWNEFVKGLSSNEKAKLIYEYVLPYVGYSQMGSPSQSIGYIDKKVLCEGYANIFRYISLTLNIPSMVIIGHVKSNAVPGQTSEGLHAWNLIKIDDKWLWCDPTWDDSINPSSPTYSFNNFLKSSSEFFTKETHLDVINWNSGLDLPQGIYK